MIKERAIKIIINSLLDHISVQYVHIYFKDYIG